MGETLKSEATVREYLLGRVSDEATLEGIEELLFTDEEFCSQVALAEDGLINDYVLGYMGEADAESFRATLAADPERRFKLELTQALREKALSARAAHAAEAKPSFLTSLEAFFRRPAYVAALSALLVAVVASVIYFGRLGGADEIAELREVYARERPTETRLSEFGYAPLGELRGATEPGERNRLRRIENSLIEATEKSPGARSHHSLGVFYLTQRKYEDSVRELTSALKFDPANARIHNDLGAAHFETAKASPRERRLEPLSRALEEFTKATELDPGLLEALFNRSLALQELGMPRQAKESWSLYLQKDSTSPWAGEARRHMERAGDAESSFRTDEQILEDFLAAYRAGDGARAERVHDETKGMLTAASVPLQLSRRLLLAKRRGDEAEARESLAAMAYVGDSESARHSDFFFRSLRATTPARAPTRQGRCLKPKRSSRARNA